MSTSLEPRFIVETAERLRKRIAERFPGSGLLGLADSVAGLARSADEKSSRIAKPHLPLRSAVWALEESLRRKRALALVNELKELAHVVDMHQLAKDPETVTGGQRTESSPKRTMTRFELGRYLDYCSEMLSVLGKLAAIYGRRIQDPVVLEAVDSAEDLSTSLSGRIWQKIAILNDRGVSSPD